MAHDSFEEDYELASGNSFRISQAQAAQWHTELVEAEKEIAALRAAAEKAREALKRISVYGTHGTMACKTLDGGLVPSEEKKNFYALVADSALAALEEVLE